MRARLAARCAARRGTPARDRAPKWRGGLSAWVARAAQGRARRRGAAVGALESFGAPRNDAPDLAAAEGRRGGAGAAQGGREEA